VGRLRAGDSGAKFVNAGSLRVGDALERYGDSGRSPIVQLRSLLEGLDEILTVVRLGLPSELRRSLACTNIIENMMGTVRRVSRNVKRWRSASMALRWTVAACWKPRKAFVG
jgi:hypothetical protein